MLTPSKCGFPASNPNPKSSEYALRRGSHRWRCRPSTHFEAKIAKISPPTGSQKWSNRTCGGAVRVVVGHVSTWAMGGHVDATLGVRTGRLWVVLTISPHKYVLSGACVPAHPPGTDVYIRAGMARGLAARALPPLFDLPAASPQSRWPRLFFESEDMRRCDLGPF